jgi:hypothetical protein
LSIPASIAYGKSPGHRAAHEPCRTEGVAVPSTAALQELVTAWKIAEGVEAEKIVEGYAFSPGDLAT